MHFWPFVLGSLVGFGVAAALFHAHLHDKLDGYLAAVKEHVEQLDDNLHERFTAFETQVAQHLHTLKQDLGGLKIFAGPRVTRIVPPPEPAAEAPSVQAPSSREDPNPNAQSVPGQSAPAGAPSSPNPPPAPAVFADEGEPGPGA